jgi:lipopolysaccharide export system permease protein
MPAAAISSPADLWRRPSVIDFYLIKLLVRPALACLGITFVAMLLEGALRLINELSARGAHLSFLFGLITSLVPYYLGLALSVSFLISIIMVVSRLDDGSEIDAMVASGRSIARLVVPFVFIGFVLSLVSLVLLGFLQPYSRFGYRAVRVAALNAGWTVQLQPQIIMSPGNGLTITADQADPTGRILDGVFVSRIDPNGNEAVATAGAGMLAPGDGAGLARLMLDRGLILRDEPGTQPQLFRFQTMRGVEDTGGTLRVEPRGGDERELTLGELVHEIGSPDTMIPKRNLRAELYARLARAFGLPILPLLALPLALATKRGRRAPGLILGAVVMVSFHHGLQLARGLAVSGTLSPELAVGGIFFGFAAFAVWLFLSSLDRPGDTPLSRLLQWAQGLLEHRAAVHANAVKRRHSVSLRGYVARLLLVRVLGAWGVLVALLQMIDLLERMTDLLERGGISAVLHYAVLRLPEMAQQTAGMAMLIGAIITFMQFARNSEMVVMRSTGLSVFQIFKKTILVALAIGLIHFIIADQLTPRAEYALSSWWASTAPKPATAEPGKGQWFRIGGDIAQASSASQGGDVLNNVRLYQRDANRTLTMRVTAKTAEAQPNGIWQMRDAVVTRVQGDRAVRSTAPVFQWRTPLRPEDAARLFSDSPDISSETARGSLAGNAPARQSRGYLATRLYRSLAEPVVAIAMLLLALPLTLAHPRSDFTRPVLYAVLGGLLYLVVDGLLTAMGQAGALPPLLAAWAAPLFFAMISVTVLLYADT